MMDACVFANGAFHLELGEGNPCRCCPRTIADALAADAADAAASDAGLLHSPSVRKPAVLQFVSGISTARAAP